MLPKIVGSPLNLIKRSGRDERREIERVSCAILPEYVFDLPLAFLALDTVTAFSSASTLASSRSTSLSKKPS